MRQVTGNNSPVAGNDRVSVRLESGGHSFSVDMLPRRAFESGVKVELVVATHKTVLVPAEVFRPADAAKYLAVAGLACASDERPLHIVAGDKVAVVAIAADCADAVAATLGERAEYTSPLLATFDTAVDELHIRTMGGVSFFHLLKAGELLFAESLATADSDEVLYCTALLDRQFGLHTYNIYISGDRADESVGVLKHYFKKVRCE